MSPNALTIADLAPLAALAASAAMLFWLFQRHIGGMPLLAYEPRRPVPWNGMAPALVLGFILAPTLIAFALGFIGSDDAPSELAPADAIAVQAGASLSGAVGGPVASQAVTAENAATADQWSIAPEEPASASLIWMQAGTFVMLALLSHAVLAALFAATPIDLGWPSSWAQARRDVRIGAAAFLAALGPVYAIQFALISIFEPESGHPLIEQLQTQHAPSMLAAAVAAAVIGAPLFEETAFRLVLQGWLERVESLRRREPTPDVLVFEQSVPEQNLDQNFDQSLAPQNTAELPSVAGGFAPIVITSVLFAMAHVGQGVAPFSLLPLGLTLGYLYQRTHRLLPSIVCHALFNAFNLLMLWLALTSGGL